MAGSIIMNKSTASGKFDQIKGKMKQGLGEAMDDDRMANSGTMDQVKGHAKEAWGNTKDAARPTSSDMKDDTADRTRAEDKHDLRNKVTSMARDAKDAVTDKVDDLKRRRSA
jgi:uncharacterized protein YjbJ (UPF0337 family)